MPIRFRDHASFHRAAAGMTGGAVLLGLAAHAMALGPTAPLIGGVLGVGMGAAIAYGRGGWRIVLGLCAAAALFVPAWQTVLVSAAVLGGALAIGARGGIRAAATLFVGMAVTLLAMWTALRVSHAERAAAWPGWERDLAASTAMGIVAVLAVLPRHLGFTADPIRAAVRALPADLDAEVRELCNRAVAIWTDATARLGEEDAGAALVRDGVAKALEVAARSAQLRPAAGGSAEALARRMEDLDARIAKATDDEVRAQYTSARAQLSDQLRYRDGIRQNRERLVARLHNHVAALEKFQLAAGGLAAAHATNAKIAGELAELSHGVAASGEALAEIELG